MPSFIETLLALNGGNLPPIPDPAKPMPLGVAAPPLAGPLLGAPPESAPTAPLPALDTNFVNQYAGAAPVRPTISQPTFLDKLSTALLGASAGLQGRAPQYIESVREERQRPIREYEAALERFNNRRTQGLEIATRRQEREQDAATRRAERNTEFEREQFLQRSKFKSEEARQLAAQAFDLEKIRERERIFDEKQREQQRAQQERDARLIARDFGKVGAKPEIALQLGRYYSGLIDEISPEAAKFESAQARLADIRARKAATGGSGTGGGSSSAVENTLAEFETLKQMAIQGVKAAGGTPQDEIEAVRRATAGVVRKMARQPKLFEVGIGEFGYPYAQQRKGASTPANITGVGPEGFPLALGVQGGPAPGQTAKPKLTNQQRARFNDIKRNQPGFSDDEILNYMQQKGWLQ